MSLGSVVGSAVGALGNALGSSGWLSYSAGKTASKKQMRRQLEYAMLEPYYRVQGLQAAGLNPILAVDSLSGGSSAQSVQPSTGSVDFDIPGAQNKDASSKLAKKQAEILDTQEEVLNSNVAKNVADAEMAQASAAKALSDSQLSKVKTLQELIRYENLPHQIKLELEKLGSETLKNNSDSGLSSARRENEARGLGTTGDVGNLIKVINTLLENQNTSAKSASPSFWQRTRDFLKSLDSPELREQLRREHEESKRSR